MRGRGGFGWGARAALALALGFLLQGCAVVGFLRYGLTQARPGSLWRGDVAPDAPVHAIDGEPRRLHDAFTGRPLVLVFGSFT